MVQAAHAAEADAARIVAALEAAAEQHAAQGPPKRQKVAKALVTEGKPPVQVHCQKRFF